MKRVEKEETITKHYIEAVDGTRFFYEAGDECSEGRAVNECRDYEKRLECVLLQRLGDKYKQVNQADKENYWKLAVAFCADEDSDVYLFTPETEDDIKNLLMLVEECGDWFNSSRRILSELKPKNKYLVIREETNYFAILSKEIVDKRVKEIKETFDKMINYKFDEKEEN